VLEQADYEKQATCQYAEAISTSESGNSLMKGEPEIRIDIYESL
jgi:hypothetical protein